MTKQQVQQAIESGARVVAGKGEDRDYGRVREILDGMAVVMWESGVTTPCQIKSLRVA